MKKITKREIVFFVAMVLLAIANYFWVDLAGYVQEANQITQEAQDEIGTGNVIDQSIQIIETAIEISSGEIEF